MIGSDDKFMLYNYPFHFLYTSEGITYDSDDGSCVAFDIITSPYLIALFKKSGTLTAVNFLPIDYTLVGSGGDGSNTSIGAAGGGGGYVYHGTGFKLAEGATYEVTIGKGSGSAAYYTEAFGNAAAGGDDGRALPRQCFGGRGGSGGSAGKTVRQSVLPGGENGSNGNADENEPEYTFTAGQGGGQSTYAFGDSSTFKMASGGGILEPDRFEYGKGGDGHYIRSGSGCQGCVVIRRHRP